jgi:hypothetical protein
MASNATPTYTFTNATASATQGSTNAIKCHIPKG